MINGSLLSHHAAVTTFTAKHCVHQIFGKFTFLQHSTLPHMVWKNFNLFESETPAIIVPDLLLSLEHNAVAFLWDKSARCGQLEAVSYWCIAWMQQSVINRIIDQLHISMFALGLHEDICLNNKVDLRITQKCVYFNEFYWNFRLIRQWSQNVTRYLTLMFNKVV